MKTFRLEFVEPPILDLKFVESPALNLDFAAQVVEVVSEPYEGQYTFTPSQELQTIEIKDRTAANNIVIEPIPENYGRIVWDGAYLKVY